MAVFFANFRSFFCFLASAATRKHAMVEQKYFKGEEGKRAFGAAKIY